MRENELTTPYYLIDEEQLIENLKCLKGVSERTNCHILLAQKAFSMFHMYPLIGRYLSGTTASGVYEARLGYEEMPGKQVHVFSPAYTEQDIEALLPICDHIVFNSSKQWKRFRDLIKKSEYNPSCGLRINPEYSEIETELYDPCGKFSRLGTKIDELNLEDIEGIEGIHFHTMCEQNADVLERTIQVIHNKFGHVLRKMKWINFGGGHHITRSDYDMDKLESCIRFMQEEYQLDVYLEPGEAVALNAGFLVTKVIETMESDMNIAILDTSAACHMPDVLEMPYRPAILHAGKPNERKYTYRLGGPTCLAGDIIGDYSFDQSLSIGDELWLCDMAIYTMVKNNTFNGMPLPSIAIKKGENISLVKQFGYEDFKRRLS